jgi:hypothetical protein
MAANSDTANPFDPAGIFKSMRDSSMEAWAKMMVQLVNTDAYSEATAHMLDAWLTASSPFREGLEKSMTKALADLNLPSRADIISMAERMTNIEMRLDDLEAKLDDLLRNPRKAAATKTRNSAAEDKP